MKIKITYNVYKYRAKQNMSLRELSAKSGISRAHINNIENNLVHPTVYTLVSLAYVLSVNLTHLFTVSIIKDK